MRAAYIEEWGDRDVIKVGDVPDPPVGPDTVLVRVKAAGVNPVDYKIRGGYMAERLPFHLPLVLGWDAAGVVEKVGPAVTWFKPGDEVYGYCRRHHLQFGTYAQLAIVPEGFLAHKPRSLSFEEAAAVPLAATHGPPGARRARAARRRDACSSAAARAASGTSPSSSASCAARA